MMLLDIVYMGYHPRIETSLYVSYITTRTRNSKLWYVNNPELEDAILGYLAKFAERYKVKLYAHAIEGNHLHTLADFPYKNRAAFMRDLNSCVKRAVQRYVKNYEGGNLAARRYSVEYIPSHPTDIESRFFYTVLQPVNDGLVPKISEYPGYNCFHDAAWGIVNKYKVIDWARFNSARRHNPHVKISDYTQEVELKYARLPGYETLSQKEYAKLLQKKLEVERNKVIEKRISEGKTGFVGTENLLKVKPGSSPHKTKTSTINTPRPRVLSVCPNRHKAGLEWYFAHYFAYKEASKKYRDGDTSVDFPPGMYKPYMQPLPPP